MKMFCKDDLNQWSPTRVITCARKKWQEERGGSVCLCVCVCERLCGASVCAGYSVCVYMYVCKLNNWHTKS